MRNRKKHARRSQLGGRLPVTAVYTIHSVTATYTIHSVTAVYTIRRRHISKSTDCMQQ